jgi:hypothetical protein
LKTFPFRDRLNQVCSNIRLSNANDVMSILLGVPVVSRSTAKSRVVFDKEGNVERRREEGIKCLFNTLITCFGAIKGSNECNDLFVYWLLHTSEGRTTFKYVANALNASENGVRFISLFVFACSSIVFSSIYLLLLVFPLFFH